MVVGSPVALGAWEYEDGFALTWSEGDIWVGTVDVAAPSTEAAEFKFVVVPPPPQTQPKGGRKPSLSAEPNVRALKVSGALEATSWWSSPSPTPFVGRLEAAGGCEKWAEESAAALAGATAAARPTDSNRRRLQIAPAVAESTPEGLEPGGGPRASLRSLNPPPRRRSRSTLRASAPGAEIEQRRLWW